MDTPYLNDIEKDKLLAFKEDELMKNAVQKFLFSGILEAGVQKEGVPYNGKNWSYNLTGLNDNAMDNEKLGALLKATNRGIAFMEDAFARLEELKKEEPQEKEVNPAE